MSATKIALIFCLVFITLFFTVVSGGAQNPVTPTPPLVTTPAFVPGEIIVKFQPNVEWFGAQSSLHAEGLRLLEFVPEGELLRVQVTPGQETQTITELLARGDVEYATFNYYVEAFGDPNDPDYTNQWGLNQPDDHDIDAPEAWNLSTGGSNITIAVIDTGVDLDHPDLQAKIVPGITYITGTTTPDDDNGHGTHVAGIAAATTNNGIGIAGVSWGARIMPIKILDAVGNGETVDLVKGIYYAVDHGARVINISLGTKRSKWPCAMPDVEAAFDYALEHGVLVVAASGNDGQNGVNCPGAYEQAIAVGSTNSNDGRSSFSNYDTRLDLVAPGSGILSTIHGGGYSYKNGTSMATPYVSGLAALIWSLSPSLTPDQVRSIIQNTTDDLMPQSSDPCSTAYPSYAGATGWDPCFGYGRINARRALEALVLQPIPSQLLLLIDDSMDSVSGNIQVVSANPNTVTWTASISTETTWLNLTPPISGQVSAASSNQLTLTATRPLTYGLYTTNVIFNGTMTPGEQIGPIVTEVRLYYLRELQRTYIPILLK